MFFMRISIVVVHVIQVCAEAATMSFEKTIFFMHV